MGQEHLAYFEVIKGPGHNGEGRGRGGFHTQEVFDVLFSQAAVCTAKSS
jgi:hypothetical protein